MQPRTSLTAQFSSFANLEANRFLGWLNDPRLVRSMETLLKTGASDRISPPQPAPDPPAPSPAPSTHLTTPGSTESHRIWGLYWHQRWQQSNHPRAEAHLVAYLQEACYWIAHRLHRQIQRAGSASPYSTSDLFQLAIAEIPPVLPKFDRKTSGNFQGFAKVALEFRLKTLLRRQRLAGFCFPWSLLRQVSQKCLIEALESWGLSPAAIEQRRLLIMGFKAHYQAQADAAAALPEPTSDELEAIAQYYNQQRTSQLSQLAPSLTANTVLQQLKETHQALRHYLYPPVKSLNLKPFDSLEGDSIEEQDLLEASDHESLLEELLEQEAEQQQRDRWAQLREVLKREFEQFDPEMQQIVCLTYQQGLTQMEIRDKTGFAQAKVSRRLSRARERIVKAILAEAGGVNNFPNPEQLKEVGHQLALCLNLYLSELGCCNQS